jgi:hypothetical protein
MERARARYEDAPMERVFNMSAHFVNVAMKHHSEALVGQKLQVRKIGIRDLAIAGHSMVPNGDSQDLLPFGEPYPLAASAVSSRPRAR